MQKNLRCVCHDQPTMLRMVPVGALLASNAAICRLVRYVGWHWRLASAALSVKRTAAAFYMAIFILLASLTITAHAQQLAILKKIPADMLAYIGGARPDVQGMVSYNQGRFRSPEFQRGAMRYMIRSILKGDRRGVNDAWRAIDATFAEQIDIGSFAGEGGPAGGPSAAAFWLCDLDQAILVLRESPFFPEYKTRIELLIPKIRKAAQWLAQRKYQERLERDDADAPNRLLFDALAYGLSGILAGDRQLQQTGRRFVDLAMARYRPSDRVFWKKAGTIPAIRPLPR